MNLPGQDTLTLLAAAVVLTMLLAGLMSVRRLRLRKAVAAKPAQQEILLQQIDARLEALANRLETSQHIVVNRLHDDIRGLQTDMDWLAGERMIDEAIAMARNGQQSQDISAELGLPMDAVQTITRFRKH